MGYFGYDRNMASVLTMSEIAALVADPARLNVLFCLANSDTASAGELTLVANVAPSTASEHLQKLVDGGLVTMRKDGRQRLFSLSRPEVAQLLDGVDNLANLVAPGGHPELRRDEAVLHARSCGDHLAGRVGVAITETALGRGWLVSTGDGLSLSRDGEEVLTRLGVDHARLSERPRRLLALCHDWSEDAFHLGGAIGGAILQSMKARDWVRHRRGALSVEFTPKGYAGVRDVLGIDLRSV